MNPLQTTLFAYLVERAKNEILIHVKTGRVPADVDSFGDLHDHVDANEYGGICTDELRPSINSAWPDPPDSEEFGTLYTQASMDATNELQNTLDRWIKRGGIAARLGGLEDA